jgi:SAM-dependent methyltransferase
MNRAGLDDKAPPLLITAPNGRQGHQMSQFQFYDREFYEFHSNGSLQSARIVVPIVLAHFEITSVIDIGCGIGTWLKAFREYGVKDIFGVDGPHVDETMLLIEKDAYVAIDLRTDFLLKGRYDLAISLEVAEHLPNEYATTLVKALTDSAPIVLFSAAIPGQGTEKDGHVNTQWQDYWRVIFASHGFVPLDIIRPAIWGRADVEFWYQQNTIVYCHTSVIAAHPNLNPTPEHLSLNIVHPALYEPIQHFSQPYLRIVLRLIPGLVLRALQRRLHAVQIKLRSVRTH